MSKRSILLSLAALIWLAWGARGQEIPWYVGLGGGTSFGQATFSSITEEGVRLRAASGKAVSTCPEDSTRSVPSWSR